jgi:hypothetical protein
MPFAWRRREALWEEEVVVVVFAGSASVCVAVVEDLLKARSHEKIT